MTKDYKLYQLLSDGEFHSGEDIAEEFGVTRSRVWGLINSLAAKGVVISRIRGKGYRIRKPSLLLDDQKIAASLKNKCRLVYEAECESSNQISKSQIGAYASPIVVATEYQTSGRGRRGRNWQSGYAQNLMFTYVQPSFAVCNGLDGLSLVVGLAIAEVIKGISCAPVSLKWPNDIQIGDAKLGGILIELQGDLAGDSNLFIGIGLNVNQAPDDIDRSVVSLSQYASLPIDRSELLIQVISKLMDYLTRFKETGFAGFKTEWSELDAYIDMPVTVYRGDEVINGISRGVDERGALLLDIDGQITSFYGGEVSVRKVNESVS